MFPHKASSSSSFFSFMVLCVKPAKEQFDFSNNPIVREETFDV
ncbi:hypothetical protein [Paenibacillus sp. RC67]|nr:hypothetical protein [Paenibacillus sp. RC67]